MSNVNAGPGWYETIHPTKATTHIVCVAADGSIYFPEGLQVLNREEFEFAAARGKAHRLVRADEEFNQAKAKALREAADELDAHPDRRRLSLGAFLRTEARTGIARWLRARADGLTA